MAVRMMAVARREGVVDGVMLGGAVYDAMSMGQCVAVGEAAACWRC
mgnify:CR=1 FL=1